MASHQSMRLAEVRKDSKSCREGGRVDVFGEFCFFREKVFLDFYWTMTCIIYKLGPPDVDLTRMWCGRLQEIWLKVHCKHIFRSRALVWLIPTRRSHKHRYSQPQFISIYMVRRLNRTYFTPKNSKILPSSREVDATRIQSPKIT